MSSWDPVWEEIFREAEWGKYPGEELIRFIARNFYRVVQRSTVKILEVGCGPGANLWYMGREGFAVYGMDGSETAVQRARQRLNQEVPEWSGEVIVGDIMKIPYPDDFFDAVIDNEAVCCNSFENSQKIYHEMARVAKPGGKIFVRTFARGCWGDETGESVGYHSYIVTEGPLAGKGYARFTALEDIPVLLNKFQVADIECVSQTYSNRQHEMKEWIIVGEKR